MSKKNRSDSAELASPLNEVQKEINLWESLIAKKEDAISELSIQVQNIKIVLNVFLGEYDSRVGLLYVKLDKIKLKLKEYRSRIDLAQNKKISQDDLANIEEEVNEAFTEERQKVNNLGDETSESSEKYREYLEQEEKSSTLSTEAKKELKMLYRKLALKFHPDKAKEDKQREEYHSIMAVINEAYKNGDQVTLRKYMEKVEREEMIAKETPEEKLARLKEDYGVILGILEKLQVELENVKVSETYKLKVKVDEGKKEDKDLLQELADQIKGEINENQILLDELVAEYKEIIQGIGY